MIALAKYSSTMSSPYFFLRPVLASDNAWCAFDWRTSDPLSCPPGDLLHVINAAALKPLADAHPLIAQVSTQAIADDALVSALDPRQVVFILPESALDNATTLQRCKALRDRGYRIGLHVTSAAPLHRIPLAGFDHLSCTGANVRQEFSGSDLRYVGDAGFRRIATAIGSYEMHDWMLGNGFEWFDSHFLAARNPHLGNTPDMTRLKLLRLLNIVRNDGDTREIEAIFREEPKLSYNLLRLVNSVAVGARTHITSFSQAIAILGRRQLQRWLQLLVYANHLAEGSAPNPLMQLAAARGRQMELLCLALDPKPQIEELCEGAYMTGLFSLLEVLINLPMSEIVKELPLQDPVLEALESPGKGGQLAQLLGAITAGEAGQFAQAAEIFTSLGITSEKHAKAQGAAMLWASHIDRLTAE